MSRRSKTLRNGEDAEGERERGGREEEERERRTKEQRERERELQASIREYKQQMLTYGNIMKRRKGQRSADENAES